MTGQDDNQSTSFDSDCRIVIAYLQGAGSVSEAAHALRRIVLEVDSGAIDEVESAILKSDVSMLREIGHMGGISLYEAPPVAPTANLLRLFKAVLRCPWLAANIFIWWLDAFPNEYLAAMKETILTHDSYGALDELAANILEHWPWFIENAAFEWLASEEPKLWPHVASMYLTVDCGINEVNLDRRRQLAEVMVHHRDPAVQAAGVSELAEVLQEIQKRDMVSRLAECLNTADCRPSENDLAEPMKTALPPLAKKLLTTYGRLQRVETPFLTSDNRFDFTAHFECAVLRMSIALDARSKITELSFEPQQSNQGENE